MPFVPFPNSGAVRFGPFNSENDCRITVLVAIFSMVISLLPTIGGERHYVGWLSVRCPSVRLSDVCMYHRQHGSADLL